MKSAFNKVLVGLAVVAGLLAVLFVPSLLSDESGTQLATQSQLLPEESTAVPAAAPTEIVLPTATAPPATATAIPASPTATPLPAAVVVVAPTSIPTVEPTPEPTAVPTVAVPTATSVPLVVAPTAVPTAEPTVAPTAEPTAVPTVEPTAEPTAVPTVEPTVEPTTQPTAQPTAVPTAQPTAASVAGPVLEIAATIMYVTSTDGLFLRDVPAGQITDVLTHRASVQLTGEVETNGERQWAEVATPSRGWVALEFLDTTQPVAQAPTTVGSSDRPAGPPGDAAWVAFRNCESGGRYTVVDPSGLYHGAYQFLPSTWDGLASRFWPELVGVLPSAASPADQDKMALRLYELEGARPWPVCGLHLL